MVEFSAADKLRRLEQVVDELEQVDDLRRERDSLIVDLHGRTDLGNILAASRLKKARIFQILNKFKEG